MSLHRRWLGWPGWRLAPLAGAVLAAHLALLWQAPVRAPWQSAPASLAGLVVRHIAADAPSTRSPTHAPSDTPSDTPAPGVDAARARGLPLTGLPTLPQPRPAAKASAPLVATPDAARPSAAAAAPDATAALPLEARVPPPQRLRYEVVATLRGIERAGHAVLNWRHDGESYEASLEQGGGTLPPRTQRSSGRLSTQGLAPERFSDRRPRGGEQATHFEHEREVLLFSTNRPAAALLPGAQDRLSVLLQLGALIAARPAAYPPGTTLALQTVTAREAQVWRFHVEAQEDLSVGTRTVQTLRLSRLPQREWDVKLELWLAPALDYVPVRLRLTLGNGDWADYRWPGDYRE